MKKTTIKFLVILVIGMLPNITVFSQVGPAPPGIPPEETPKPAKAVPVDGGIGLALAAGVAMYSKKKLKKKSNKE
jgi:hypothetical protein